MKSGEFCLPELVDRSIVSDVRMNDGRLISLFFITFENVIYDREGSKGDRSVRITPQKSDASERA